MWMPAGIPEPLAGKYTVALRYTALGDPAEAQRLLQPMREMGAAACRRLFEVIETPGQVQTIEFPMRLMVRETTAAVRAAARSTAAR